MTAFRPWSVVHLPIRDPLPDLDADADVGGLFVVFWCDRIPLGQLLIPAPLLPISSAQLAAVISSVVAPAVGFRTVRAGFEPPFPILREERVKPAPPTLAELIALNGPLASIARQEHRQDEASAAAQVSVVICTRNRPEYLKRCLAAMNELSPPPNEILVVDNDPESGQTRTVTDCFPAVRYVPEPQPGLSAARNTGVLNCTGALVAFTDDDVIVHSAWIGAIREAFSDRDLMALTGLVLPAELSTRAQLAFQTDTRGWDYRPLDFDATFFESAKHQGVPTWRMGAGANMAFRREVFDCIGLFDERLGAGAAGCSEDSELWYRLLAQGHRCRYWPAAVVLHYHRADWDELRRQMHCYMRGHVVALLVQFERYKHWGNIYRAFLGLPLDLARFVFDSSKRRFARLFYEPRDESVARPVAPQILGALAGYGYYLRHRARRSNATALRPARTEIAAR